MHVFERPKTHLAPALLAIVAAALLNALIGAFVKYASHGLTVEAMTFWRNFICLIAVFPWLIHATPHPTMLAKVKPKSITMHLIRGLSGLTI